MLTRDDEGWLRVNGEGLRVRNGFCWHCIAVKTGEEFVTARALYRKGAAVFVPLDRGDNDTVRPLWAGYLYAQLDERLELFVRNELRCRILRSVRHDIRDELTTSSVARHDEPHAQNSRIVWSGRVADQKPARDKLTMPSVAGRSEPHTQSSRIVWNGRVADQKPTRDKTTTEESAIRREGRAVDDSTLISDQGAVVLPATPPAQPSRKAATPRPRVEVRDPPRSQRELPQDHWSNEKYLLDELKRLKPFADMSNILRVGQRVVIAEGPGQGRTGVISGYRKTRKTFAVDLGVGKQAWHVDVPLSSLLHPPVSEPSNDRADADKNITQAEREFALASVEAFDAEVIQYLAKHPELVRTLSPYAFERLIADILTDMGYDVHLTPPTRDGGRDVLAVLPSPTGPILTIVECKRFAAERPVGVDIVERFLWIIEHRDRANCGIIATTSYFTRGAYELQHQFRFRLLLRDMPAIEDWLSRYGSWRRSSTANVWIPS